MLVPEVIIILMLLGMILGREHVVAFENPTYKQAYRLFRGLAYKTVPVGMDKNGMKVTELSDSRGRYCIRDCRLTNIRQGSLCRLDEDWNF